MGFPPLLGVSAGANILSTGFGIAAARQRADRMVRALLAEANKEQSLERQAEFAPSETEGNLANAATRRTLSGLAQRGVLHSSIAPGAVAQAVAPFEQQRQERLAGHRRRSSDLRLAAAQVSSSAPGFKDFLGGALGQAGSLLAMKAGYDLSLKKQKAGLEQLASIFDQDDGTQGAVPEVEDQQEAPYDPEEFGEYGG